MLAVKAAEVDIEGLAVVFAAAEAAWCMAAMAAAAICCCALSSSEAAAVLLYWAAVAFAPANKLVGVIDAMCAL